MIIFGLYSTLRASAYEPTAGLTSAWAQTGEISSGQFWGVVVRTSSSKDWGRANMQAMKKYLFWSKESTPEFIKVFLSHLI